MLSSALIAGWLLMQQVGAPAATPACDLGVFNSTAGDPKWQALVLKGSSNAVVPCDVQEQIAQVVTKHARENGFGSMLDNLFVLLDRDEFWLVALAPRTPAVGGDVYLSLNKRTLAVVGVTFGQ